MLRWHRKKRSNGKEKSINLKAKWKKCREKNKKNWKKNLIKLLTPKSHYFHQIKQASRLDKGEKLEENLLCPKKRKKEKIHEKVKDERQWCYRLRRGRRKIEVLYKKRWQKLNELWYHLIRTFRISSSHMGFFIIHRFAINVLGLFFASVTTVHKVYHIVRGWVKREKCFSINWWLLPDK